MCLAKRPIIEKPEESTGECYLLAPLFLTGSDADAILGPYGGRKGSQCGSEYADEMRYRK